MLGLRCSYLACDSSPDLVLSNFAQHRYCLLILWLLRSVLGLD